MFDSQSLRYSLRESSTIPKFAYKLALSTTGHTPPNFLWLVHFLVEHRVFNVSEQFREKKTKSGGLSFFYSSQQDIDLAPFQILLIQFKNARIVLLSVETVHFCAFPQLYKPFELTL